MIFLNNMKHNTCPKQAPPFCSIWSLCWPSVSFGFASTGCVRPCMHTHTVMTEWSTDLLHEQRWLCNGLPAAGATHWRWPVVRSEGKRRTARAIFKVTIGGIKRSAQGRQIHSASCQLLRGLLYISLTLLLLQWWEFSIGWDKFLK